MTTVSLRLDDELKKELDQMCEEMGMSLTTFFTVYAKRALRERRIPFEINAPLPALDPERLNWARSVRKHRKRNASTAQTPECLWSRSHISSTAEAITCDPCSFRILSA